MEGTMSILSLLAQADYYTSDYYSSDYSSSYSNVDPAAAGAALAFVSIIWLGFAVAAYVVTALLLSRIFKKAGVEAWKAWVPVYNSWVLLELGDQKGFWAVLAFVPVVNIVSIVFMYIAMYNIGLKLGKGGEFVLWAIFVPIVWLIWLAVDDSKWNNKAVKKA
jgi:hypothetical protein